MSDQKIRPSRIYYLIAVIIVIMGACFFISSCWKYFNIIIEGPEIFQIPGKHEVILQEKGKYLIFHEYKTFKDGQPCVVDENLADNLLFALIEKDTKKKITLIKNRIKSTYSVGEYEERQGVAIVDFWIENAGNYELIVDYPPGHKKHSLNLTVQPGFKIIFKHVIKALRELALWINLAALGIIAAIIIFVRRFSEKDRLKHEAGPRGEIESISGTEVKSRRLAALCHLSALIEFLGFPWGNLWAPFLIWAINQKDSEFFDTQGKEALNFQMSMTIYSFIAGLLIFAVVGIAFLFIIPVIKIILVIMAAVKVSNGKAFRYPITIRFLH